MSVRIKRLELACFILGFLGLLLGYAAFEFQTSSIVAYNLVYSNPYRDLAEPVIVFGFIFTLTGIVIIALEELVQKPETPDSMTPP